MKYLMNRLKTVFVSTLVLLLVLTTGCDDVLDENAISQIGGQNFWRNNNDATAGIIGIYDAMQKTYRDKYFLWGEFRSDNFGPGGETANQNNLSLVFNTVNQGNSSATRWNNFYKIISSANLAIENIPKIQNVDTELLGEAYAQRAFAYFDAVRVWGAAPLYTTPIIGLDQELELTRTDGNVILNTVVIPDMLKAEELIIRVQDPYRFSKNSIWAFQASVYMWLKEYDKAQEALQKIVDSGIYSLVTNETAWQNLFLNDDDFGGKIQTGPELIMSINFDLADNDRAQVYNLFFGGLPSFYLSKELELKWQEKFPIDSLGWVTKYPNVDPVLEKLDVEGNTIPIYGDWRYYFCREDGIDGAFDEDVLGRERMAKFVKSNGQEDDSDIVLFRYAGVLLMLAEAENQLGNGDRALELVNEIRTARKLPLVTADEFGGTIAERENYILDERQLELLGEGKRWWDLRRTDKVLEVMNPVLENREGANLHDAQGNSLLFPIFVEHLLDNPNLTQNEGY